MVQQQLPKDFVAQVSYVGDAGHHLFSKYTVNLINPATGKRPLAAFGSFGLKANDGNSDYSGASGVPAAPVHARPAAADELRVVALLSPTPPSARARAIGFQNMGCRACDRSSSSFDVRHTWMMNAVYQLPFGRGGHYLSGSGVASQIIGGWELAGIAFARTGLPVNIGVSRSAAALLDGNTSGQRPNLVAGVPIYAANQSITNWFNPAAFSAPANGTWGNLGRLIANGPGTYEIDSSLQKRFHVTERLALNFRAAAFNLMNHPQYKNPGASIGSVSGTAPNLTIKPSASFGRITSILNTGATGTGAPRRIEFMFRAEF